MKHMEKLREKAIGQLKEAINTLGEICKKENADEERGITRLVSDPEDMQEYWEGIINIIQELFEITEAEVPELKELKFTEEAK